MRLKKGIKILEAGYKIFRKFARRPSLLVCGAAVYSILYPVYIFLIFDKMNKFWYINNVKWESIVFYFIV